MFLSKIKAHIYWTCLFLFKFIHSFIYLRIFLFILSISFSHGKERPYFSYQYRDNISIYMQYLLYRRTNIRTIISYFHIHNVSFTYTFQQRYNVEMTGFQIKYERAPTFYYLLSVHCIKHSCIFNGLHLQGIIKNFIVFSYIHEKIVA